MNTSTEGKIEQKHSTRSMLSYSATYFGLRSIPNIVVARFTFFYETEILLPIGLMTIAVIIYTIWDMFNDPFFGHLTDRNFRFTRRWGRRFPWIVTSCIGLFIAFILFFMPPDPTINIWATFFWFLALFMLFDGLASLATVAYQSLLPNKYKTKEERVKVSALMESISAVGLMLGFILPPLIIVYGDPSSYVTMSVICGFLLLISLILGIPGMREEKDLIDSYYLKEEKHESFLKTFFEIFRKSFSQKNFVALVIVNMGIAVFSLLFVASISYFVAFVMKETAEFELIIYLPYLIAVVAPIPLYYWLIKKFGQYKVVINVLFILPTILMILAFLSTNIIALIILVFLMGMTNGLLSMAFTPLTCDFFDEAAVLNKKRQEGFYNGLQTFFGRAMFLVQIISFWLVHETTGFNAEASEQTPLAQFGIIILWLIIPAVALYIGIILFVKMYDLKPEKMVKIKEQLKELNL